MSLLIERWQAFLNEGEKDEENILFGIFVAMCR